jgi:3,4-dihydroxy-9,10-secoandrosta-1,3,5(10)-triene-9,17-dione 4,5-dioxygenase
MARFDDPAGNPVELFYGPVLDHVPVQLPAVSSFVTGDMGMGHVIVTAEDGRGLVDFYTSVLGFYERNTMPGRGGPVWFLSPNDRHHTLGVATAPGRGRLVHLMVEAATLDDVGRALDRADKLGIPLMNSLGKHTNDEMVSFYAYSPENYAIEFGTGGLRVHGEQPTYEITAGAHWGHKFSPPPRREGAR